MASADGNAPPAKEIDAAPALCAHGCGFFGNPATGGMCSKCFKETMAKTAASAAPAPAPAPAVAAAPAPTPLVCEPIAAPAPPAPAPVESAPPVAAEPAAASTSAAASPAALLAAAPPVDVTDAAKAAAVAPAVADEPDESEEPPKKVQANTSRCWTCNRKIGLLGFQCKCEYWYCAEHRYSDKHNCSFDFKGMGKQQLTKANPTIAPSKMETI